MMITVPFFVAPTEPVAAVGFSGLPHQVLTCCHALGCAGPPELDALGAVCTVGVLVGRLIADDTGGENADVIADSGFITSDST